MRKKLYHLVVVLVTVALSLTGVLLLLSTWPSSVVRAEPLPPEVRAYAVDQVAAYDPNSLSYGLYWFGKEQANQKFVADEANAYFDPAKPTLIFAHGWQPYISNELPDFDFDKNDTIAAWIDDGWNVGIFVWNQFADETTGVTPTGSWFTDGPPQGVLDAEAKIWTSNGPKEMRWRDWSEQLWEGGYKPGPDKSAGQLFYETYLAALDGYTGTIRLAGHSLGNQMVVRLTKLVDDGVDAGDVAEDLRPARVALLDPYWSPEARDDLSDGPVAGKKTGDVVREYITALKTAGTRFEWYWSSEWTTPNQGDANDALKPLVLYAEMDPQYASSGLERHMAPRHLYFWAYEFPQDPACGGLDDECRLLGPMSDAQVTTFDGTRWQQIAGGDTATPSDDLYTATQTTTQLPTVAFDAATYTVGEAEGSAPITVTLQNPPTQTVTVDYATFEETALAGSDYLTASGTLTFTSGATWLTFTVAILDDDLSEGEESLTLSLSQPVNGTLGLFDTATLMIVDDDANKIYLPLVLRQQG